MLVCNARCEYHRGDSLSLINVIDHCGVLVLIVSEHTSKSPEITDQVQRSVKNRTPIIPVRIGNLPEVDLAKLFADVHLLGWLNGTVPAFQEEIVSRVKSISIGRELRSLSFQMQDVKNSLVSLTDEFRSFSQSTAGPENASRQMHAASRQMHDYVENSLDSLKEEVESFRQRTELLENALKKAEEQVAALRVENQRLKREREFRSGAAVEGVTSNKVTRSEPKNQPRILLQDRIAAAPASEWDASAQRVVIRKPQLDAVEFGASHPSIAPVQESFLVDAWIFQKADRDKAIRRATQGASTGFRSGGAAGVTRGSTISVKLEVEDWEIKPRLQRIFWSGKIESVPFSVTPHPDGAEAQRKKIGTLTFSVGGLRIGTLMFELFVGSSVDWNKEVSTGNCITRAFASYAARDRRHVLTRVQGMEKRGVNVFMDVRNLRTTEEYPYRLLQQIDQSDVLYLFWSRHAKRSKWVEREWRHGMENKGIDFIDPVPLADPRKVPPPSELASHKHFNCPSSEILRHRAAQIKGGSGSFG